MRTVSKMQTLPAGWRCLVLEDEFLIALDLRDILEGAGAASVTCFPNSDDAMRALMNGAAFDFAVLDVHLGGASRTSLSVAAELAARKTPFVFLTGMRPDAAHTAGHAAPVLEKPYQQAALLDTILAVLARAENGR